MIEPGRVVCALDPFRGDKFQDIAASKAAVFEFRGIHPPQCVDDIEPDLGPGNLWQVFQLNELVQVVGIETFFHVMRVQGVDQRLGLHETAGGIVGHGHGAPDEEGEEGEGCAHAQVQRPLAQAVLPVFTGCDGREAQCDAGDHQHRDGAADSRLRETAGEPDQWEDHAEGDPDPPQEAVAPQDGEAPYPECQAEEEPDQREGADFESITGTAGQGEKFITMFLSQPVACRSRPTINRNSGM